MAKPVSDEKRADIIRHMEAGERKADIAKWLFICVRTVTRIWNIFNATGSYAPEPQNSGQKPLVSDEVMGQIVSKIREVPDMTLFELIEEFNLPISKAALSKRLIRLGFTYKKKLSIRMQESVKTSLRQGRHGG